MKLAEAYQMFQGEENLKFLGSMALLHIWVFNSVTMKPFHLAVARNFGYLHPDSTPENPKLKPGYFAGYTLTENNTFILDRESTGFPDNYPTAAQFRQMLESEIQGI